MEIYIDDRVQPTDAIRYGWYRALFTFTVCVVCVCVCVCGVGVVVGMVVGWGGGGGGGCKMNRQVFIDGWSGKIP